MHGSGTRRHGQEAPPARRPPATFWSSCADRRLAPLRPGSLSRRYGVTRGEKPAGRTAAGGDCAGDAGDGRRPKTNADAGDGGPKDCARRPAGRQDSFAGRRLPGRSGAARACGAALMAPPPPPPPGGLALKNCARVQKVSSRNGRGGGALSKSPPCLSTPLHLLLPLLLLLLLAPS
jgi:hypothetical protein